MWVFCERGAVDWDIQVSEVDILDAGTAGARLGDRVFVKDGEEECGAKGGYVRLFGRHAELDGRMELYIGVEKSEELAVVYGRVVEAMACHPHYVDLRDVAEVRVVDTF